MIPRGFTTECVSARVVRVMDTSFERSYLAKFLSLPIAKILRDYNSLELGIVNDLVRTTGNLLVEQGYTSSDDVFSKSRVRLRIVPDFVKRGRTLTIVIRDIATKAGAEKPALLARQLLLLKEGAIVTAHLQGPSGVADDAKQAAKILIDHALRTGSESAVA